MLMTPQMLNIILSIAMLTVGGLLWGSYRLFRSGPASRQKAWLMLAAAVVLLANVLILTV